MCVIFMIFSRDMRENLSSFLYITKKGCILWCVYGVLFSLIGLPLLSKQNSGLIIISVLGAMLISIAAMVVYVVVIEPKYRKK